MKVRLLKEDKKYITMEEAPIVCEIIASMKEDTSTTEEYAEMAVRAACNGTAYNIEILKATAGISKNNCVCNKYTEDSGCLDIWIKATAYVNNDEFIMINFY